MFRRSHICLLNLLAQWKVMRLQSKTDKKGKKHRTSQIFFYFASYPIPLPPTCTPNFVAWVRLWPCCPSVPQTALCHFKTVRVLNLHLHLFHHNYNYTVSGQNTIGIYITQLVLIQPSDIEQNAVINNWLLKLQPAVKLQSWQKSNFHQIE